jgi:transposase
VGTTTKLQYPIYACYEDREQCVACLKRLEKGRFSWPTQGDENGKVRLSQEQLTMLVGGIELKQTRRKDWYRKEIVEAGAEKSGDKTDSLKRDCLSYDLCRIRVQ